MGRSCTLNKIQLKNVRSLKDTGMQQLAPITILVGENSSGKSTFLRAFPLLKQSISKKTAGPILWAGDVDDYVDFGSFDETVTNDGSDEITFAFDFNLSWDKAMVGRGVFLEWVETTGDAPFWSPRVIYEITIGRMKEKGSQVNKLHLTFGDYTVVFDFLSGKVYVEGNKAEPLITIDGKTGFEFPFIRRTASTKGIFDFELPDFSDAWSGIEKSLFTEEKDGSGDQTSVDSLIQQLAIGYVGELLFEGVAPDNLGKRIPKKSQVHDSIGTRTYSKVKAIAEKLKKMEKSQKKAVIDRIKLYFVYYCFGNIEEYLQTYFKCVHYIAPIRATAERYYRVRNLAVDEVDHQGKNLPMVINSLPKEELKKFQKWTLDSFGFKVSTAPMEGHLSLKIGIKDSGKEINLSDTGFGYSQILPIVTQIWLLSTRERMFGEVEVPLIVAIEQPELHLHPAMQARLAGAFIAGIRLAKEHGYALQFILETHSETIVDYFGHAISRGELKSEEVEIILFEKDPETNLTSIRNSRYDKEGYLVDWPTGFLAPRY